VITPASILATLRRLGSRALGPSPSNRRGNSYALTIVTPILPGKSDDLRSVLDGFNCQGKSPLANIPDVHFAQWIVIDQLRTDWPHAPKQPSILGSEYLLFSADLTAPAYRANKLPGSFLRDLAQHVPDRCNEVWENCYGYPGADDGKAFVEYLTRSQVEIGLYYAAFPDLTPVEVTSAMKLREQLAAFVLRHPDELAGAGNLQKLRDDYIHESKCWGY
jgi:hypothetical protein